MNTLYRYIHTLYSWLLFCRFSVCKGSMEVLVGITGDRITLPCSYNVRTHGRSSVCWGRDKVPMSKCSKTIISTDGDEVNFRESDRYQLLSGVTRGNVSLTIINVTENDSGTYGCRAEISGPFNDLKINFHLNVVKDQRKLQFSTAETTTDNPTPERKNSASVWSTASLSQTTIQHKGVFGSIAYPPEARVPNGGGEDGHPLYACILESLLVVLTLVTLFVFITWLRKKNQGLKPRMTQEGAFPGAFSVGSSTDPQPPAREMAVENIYQADSEHTYEMDP